MMGGLFSRRNIEIRRTNQSLICGHKTVKDNLTDGKNTFYGNQKIGIDRFRIWNKLYS